jgi:hypothetical protein
LAAEKMKILDRILMLKAPLPEMMTPKMPMPPKVALQNEVRRIFLSWI